MNNRDRTFYDMLLYILIAGAAFGVGVGIGSFIVGDKFVNERLQLCKDAGGEYSLLYESYRDKYFDRCKRTEEYIDLDVLEDE